MNQLNIIDVFEKTINEFDELKEPSEIYQSYMRYEEKYGKEHIYSKTAYYLFFIYKSTKTCRDINNETNDLHYKIYKRQSDEKLDQIDIFFKNSINSHEFKTISNIVEETTDFVKKVETEYRSNEYYYKRICRLIEEFNQICCEMELFTIKYIDFIEKESSNNLQILIKIYNNLFNNYYIIKYNLAEIERSAKKIIDDYNSNKKVIIEKYNFIKLIQSIWISSNKNLLFVRKIIRIKERFNSNFILPNKLPFWICEKCTFHNSLEMSLCEMCNADKPEKIQ